MIKDKFRTILGIRAKRETPAMGAKPRMGGKIALGSMRMYVTANPSDELWYFFSLQGWREITFPRDRRKYIDLPRASFDLLARCGSAEREVRYRQLVASANQRAQAKTPRQAASSAAR
ncbi:MAG: hypothetical protein GX652_06905 [Burkholderiaceae bacterium]|nr:hypothetical protein [Burkholderiaceae bacterium]